MTWSRHEVRGGAWHVAAHRTRRERQTDAGDVLACDFFLVVTVTFQRIHVYITNTDCRVFSENSGVLLETSRGSAAFETRKRADN